MAHKVRRFPSGFVLVDRKIKSIADVNEKADIDSELRTLYNEVLAARIDPEGKILLHVGLVARRYLGADIKQWVRDQVEFAKLDTVRWSFFIDFCRILCGEDRSLVSWRNVIGKSIVGEVTDFASFAASRDRTKRKDEDRMSHYVDTERFYSSNDTAELIVKMGSTEAVAFFLYVLYGQDAEFLENIRNNRVTHWLPHYRQK